MHLEKDMINNSFVSADADALARWRFAMDRVIEHISKYISKAASKGKKISAAPPTFWQPAKPGQEIEDIVAIFFDSIAPEFVNYSAHGFLTGFHSAPCTAGQIGGLIATILNQNIKNHNSPGSLTLAANFSKMLREIVNYSQAVFYTTSTYDSHVNAISMALAHYAGKRYQVDIKQEGIGAIPQQGKLAVLVSKHCNPALGDAVEQLGLGRKSLVKIALDHDGRMDIQHLRKEVYQLQQQSIYPFCIIANAGSSLTGIIDPLPQIAEVAEENDIWYHLDASYGGSFLLAQEVRKKFKGYKQADSLVWTPAYRLHTTLPCSLLLLKHKDYLQFLPGRGPADSEEKICSKALEGALTHCILSLLLTVKHLGMDILEGLLTQSIQNVQTFYYYLQRQDDFATLLAPVLDVLCFRYQPPGLTAVEALNKLNQHIKRILFQRGRKILSLVAYNKQTYLRVNPINPLTTIEDLTSLVEEIRKVK